MDQPDITQTKTWLVAFCQIVTITVTVQVTLVRKMGYKTLMGIT